MPTLRFGRASISTANTNTNGTGTITDLIVGGANGTRVDIIVIQATANTNQGMIRLFTYNGSTWGLVHEEQVASVTGSAVTPLFRTTLRLAAINIGNGQKLGVSTNNAEPFVVTAMAYDY